MSTRLVQIENGQDRKIGLVDDRKLRLLEGADTVYDLASAAFTVGTGLAQLALAAAGSQTLDYDEVYAGASPWVLLPSLDHPREPARCMISGTGLTHLGSVARRDAMHADAQELTDSMRMFRWGVAGGKPATGEIGVSPEWFYKGDGDILRACNQAVALPWFAEDGGEEPEIAGAYIISPSGEPYRIGFTIGNEYSDHKFEKRNYLYLASSKLRECSIGPELIVDGEFADVHGTVSIERSGQTLWEKSIRTGEMNMCHSVANMEHHHFKFDAHRRPGDVHIHFFGADAFSFGEALTLEAGDIMQVAFENFGRPLRNPLSVDPKQSTPVSVKVL